MLKIIPYSKNCSCRCKRWTSAYCRPVAKIIRWLDSLRLLTISLSWLRVGTDWRSWLVPGFNADNGRTYGSELKTITICYSTEKVLKISTLIIKFEETLMQNRYIKLTLCAVSQTDPVGVWQVCLWLFSAEISFW